MKKIVLSAVMAIALLGGTTMMMAQDAKPKSRQEEKTEVVKPKKEEQKTEKSETQATHATHAAHAAHAKKGASCTKSNTGKQVEAAKKQK